MTAAPRIESIEHVQLAMPAGGEDEARAFYVGVLGFREIPKPPSLAGRGGVWLTSGTANVHLGVEERFAPARKAHPAFVVSDLDALLAILLERDLAVDEAVPIEGWRRAYVHDPFGNRVEIMQAARGA